MGIIFCETFDDGDGYENGQDKEDEVEGHIIIVGFFGWFLVELYL